MRIVGSALVAAIMLASTAPAEAASTREYFTARLQAGPPQQLDQAERAYYREVFAAIDRGDWAAVEALLAQRDGLLHPVARAEYYLAANSPRVELPQIEAWMQRGYRLPMAQRLARLALTRGATSMPRLPEERTLYPLSSAPKRVRPRSVEDGTMPAEVRQQILERISNDDPHGARQLLDGVDALLSPEARAEWRQRVAWSYYIENMDPQALAMARTVAEGRGPWVAEGDWAAGLAAWRLSDCATAGAHFERAAGGAANAELRGAGYYWASRNAAPRCCAPRPPTMRRSTACLPPSNLGRPCPSASRPPT